MLTGWTDFGHTLRTLDRLQRRMDRILFDWVEPPSRLDPLSSSVREATLARNHQRAPAAWPAVNVFEAKEAFVVRADLPGVADTDVSVLVEDDVLVLRGERKAAVPDGYRVHLRERAPIAFTRKLPLPARIDASAVTATLEQGLLTVTLPKAKDALPRQIAVKVA
jgi:HSP20 family protein